MTDTELHERMKASVKGWEETGAILEAERDEHIRNADTVKSVATLSGMTDLAVAMDFHPYPCGLIEFYQIMARSRQ